MRKQSRLTPSHRRVAAPLALLLAAPAALAVTAGALPALTDQGHTATTFTPAIVGTFTAPKPTPMWERLSSTSSITYDPLTNAEKHLGVGRTVASVFPSSAVAAVDHHPLLLLATTAPVRGDYFTTGTGVKIDLLDESGELVPFNSVSGVSGTPNGGTLNSVPLPVMVNGSKAGTTHALLYMVAFEQSAEVNGSGFLVKGCLRSSTGMFDGVAPHYRNSKAEQVLAARALYEEAGGKTLEVRKDEMKKAANNTLAMPTSEPDSVCAKPTQAKAMYSYDYGVFFKMEKPAMLYFDAPVQSSMRWTVPFNFRVQYI